MQARLRPQGRTPDQHDAYTAATWLRDGRSLQAALKPDLLPPLRTVAQVKG